MWTDPWTELDQFERCYWRGLVAKIISAILTLFLGLACLLVLAVGMMGCAQAEGLPAIKGVADIGKGGSITLYGSPCDGKVAEILARLPLRPEFRGGWQRADGVFFMKNTQQLQAFAGCWMEPPTQMTGGERAAVLFFEDGDSMAIPLERFSGVRGLKPAGLWI